MRLALFDFDGTISNRDSFLLYLQHAVGLPRFVAGSCSLLPRLILFFMKKYPNARLKQDFVSTFLGGWEIDEARNKARVFARDCIPSILRPLACERLDWHSGEGDRIVIVSASLGLVLEHWCDTRGYDLLATELEILDGRVSGRLAGENCRGVEKVTRIRAAYERGDYSEIWAYGDSKGDLPMLEMADRSFYKPFRDRRDSR